MQLYPIKCFCLEIEKANFVNSDFTRRIPTSILGEVEEAVLVELRNRLLYPN